LPWAVSGVNRIGKFLLRLALGVAILVGVVLVVDVSNVWTVLAGLDPWPFLLAFVLLLSARLLVGLKWWLLLGGRASALRYAVVQRAIFLADYQALLFPNTLAVDAMRLVLLRHHPRGTTYMAATIVADRIINVMVAALLALIGMLLVHALPIGVVIEPAVLGIVVGTALTVLAAGTALLSSRLFTLVMVVLERGLAKGPLQRPVAAIAAKAREVHRAMSTMLADPDTLLKAVGVASAVVMVRVAQVYCLFAAVGVLLPVLPVLAIFPIITLLVLLPISFLGIGVQDGAFIFFFGSLSVQPGTALAASLALYAMILGGCIVSGMVATVVGPPMPTAEDSKAAQ
jgi:glycosyltransferase 2 family protein